MAVDPNQQRTVDPVELLLPHSIGQDLLSFKLVWGAYSTTGGSYALLDSGSGGWTGAFVSTGTVDITFNPTFQAAPIPLAWSTADETVMSTGTWNSAGFRVITATAAGVATNTSRTFFLAIGGPVRT